MACLCVASSGQQTFHAKSVACFIRNHLIQCTNEFFSTFYAQKICVFYGLYEVMLLPIQAVSGTNLSKHSSVTIFCTVTFNCSYYFLTTEFFEQRTPTFPHFQTCGLSFKIALIFSQLSVRWFSIAKRGSSFFFFEWPPS